MTSKNVSALPSVTPQEFQEWLEAMPKGKIGVLTEGITLNVPITLPLTDWIILKFTALNTGKTLSETIEAIFYSIHFEILVGLQNENYTIPMIEVGKDLKETSATTQAE